MTLSSRGSGIADGALPPYIAAHKERDGQEGYTALSVAENLLVFDLLAPRLQAFPPVPPEAVSYSAGALTPRLRRAVAGILGREVCGRDIDPEHVRLTAGASGLLDALGHALGDPGDGVLVPTPSYAGFWFDLQVRPGLRIVEVPTSSDDGFRLTPELLQRAMDAADVPVRMLLLTNPDNPRGQVMPAQDVAAVLGWAEERGLHVIADEIYAMSVYGSDGPSPDHFPSVARLRPSFGDRLHLVWALSKDFGMSGMRAGVLVSENAALRRAIDVQELWSGVSGLTQHVLAEMLADEAWTTAFLAESRRRLARAAEAVTSRLARARIPHLRPTAGFFLLADLRGVLTAPTWAAEDALWRRILDEAGVNLTPGSALRAPQPGWFRICFAANPPEEVAAALDRVVALLG